MEACAACERPRGRRGALPPDERRAKLLQVAEGLFLERGYADVAMADIAERAMMSKRTLYAVFPTKAALFADVVRATLAGDVPHEIPDGPGSPAECLAGYLHGYALGMLSDRRIGLMRTLIAEAGRDPTLAEAFYDGSMRLGPQVLAAWIETRCAEGTMAVEDAREAGLMLFGMAVGHPHMMRLVGQHSPRDADLRARIDRAVHIFLAGCTPRPVA